MSTCPHTRQLSPGTYPLPLCGFCTGAHLLCGHLDQVRMAYEDTRSRKGGAARGLGLGARWLPLRLLVPAATPVSVELHLLGPRLVEVPEAQGLKQTTWCGQQAHHLPSSLHHCIILFAFLHFKIGDSMSPRLQCEEQSHILPMTKEQGCGP